MTKLLGEFDVEKIRFNDSYEGVWRVGISPEYSDDIILDRDGDMLTLPISDIPRMIEALKLFQAKAK